MKTIHATPLIQMEKQALEKLCTEVKETLATNANIKTISKHPFGVADLWKIHRNTRYRMQRRNTML